MFNVVSWTDARIDQLKALYADGLSSSQIAREIGGLTRNAVIGKVHRLGLHRASRPRPGPGPSVPVAPKSSIAIGPTLSRQADGGIVEKVRFGVKARKAVADNDRAPKQRVAAPAKFLGITFMELEDGRCRFPRGEGRSILFCGQPAVEGHSYCIDCCKIAFQPPAPHRDNSPAPARYAAGPGAGLRAFIV